MRNLKPYGGDDFEFHLEVVNSKRNTAKDPEYKNRITSQNQNINKKFVEYKECFDGKTLTSLIPHPFTLNSKKDLQKLYSYQNKVIQKLKIDITTSDTDRIINTCQNCTISEVNSLDHILPQEEYSEYVVNPKNLFPSCTQCNSYKSKNWKNQQNESLFLNLYLDILPKEQYLFVDIEIENGILSVNFRLENQNNIDSKLYNLIVEHYTRLNLLNRFRENIDNVVIPLKNSIDTYKHKLPIDEIVQVIIETSEKNKKSFGYNYWKSILEISLVSNQNFIDDI